jgi:ATP-dependent DNA helicase RecQ
MDKEKREEAQTKWMAGDTPVIVATTAFGMGIDKPDVRMVLHYDSPEHLEAYYQEAGRGGRDGKPSKAAALYNSSDINRLSDSVLLQFPPEAYLRQVYQSVVEYLQIPIGCEPDKYYPFDVFDFCRKFDLQSNRALHALKLLEREDLWTLSESVHNPATIQFIADRHTIDDLGKFDKNLAYVSVGLLRMYNSIFFFPTPVWESAICSQLKLPREELDTALETLHRMKILEYTKTGEGPHLYFHHYRVDSRYLLIDLNRINQLRKRHEARTNAMIAYLENKTVCRERIILEYFGERPGKDCGHCDICHAKQMNSIQPRNLRNGLLQIISNSEGIQLQSIAGMYPTPVRQDVIALIRELMDDGVIAMHADNSLFVISRKNR